MKIDGLVVLASALALVLAPACSASSADSAPPAEAGPGGSSSGAMSGSGSGGKGAPTEQQILCLGNFYCTPGTVCCADMMQNAACSTGPACPFGRFQLCMTDSDCNGRACSPITVTGITAGICGFGGGSSSSGGGSSSGEAGGDGGDSGGDALGDGSSGADSDAPAE